MQSNNILTRGSLATAAADNRTVGEVQPPLARSPHALLVVYGEVDVLNLGVEVELFSDLVILRPLLSGTSPYHT